MNPDPIVVYVTAREAVGLHAGMEVKVGVKGHLTDATQKGYDVTNEIMGNRRWRVIAVDYTAPEFNQFASDGVTHIAAIEIRGGFGG